MSPANKRSAEEIRQLIANSRLSIYDVIERTHPCFLDIEELEQLLQMHLRGASLQYPIRTRAKVAKTAVCVALGYPVPTSFVKTQPRFPGQDLDVYVQKSNNLQIWNEEIAPTRRYALVRLDSDDVITAVRVLSGESIALLDRTGTLTSKYQARRREDGGESKLVSREDTESFRRALASPGGISAAILSGQMPTDAPARGAVLTISEVWERLSPLVGTSVFNPGLDQERNRGAGLQKIVCERLGLKTYRDEGQFPDVRSQALEVKLQTSPTIDLGLVSPDGAEPVDGLGHDLMLSHRDMRYAVFYGACVSNDSICLTGLVLATGAEFFNEFRRFGGLVQNRKLQIPLPLNLFREPE